MKKQECDVQQVFSVTEDIARECYYVMSEYVGNAGVFYEGLPTDVEKRGDVLFVNMDEFGINGFIKGQMFDSGAQIEHLYVTKNKHGCGIGSALMQGFLSKAKKIGIATVRVRARMLPQALNFYEKHGFVRNGYGCCMTKEL